MNPSYIKDGTNPKGQKSDKSKFSSLKSKLKKEVPASLDSKKAKAKLKSATSRKNWINYFVLIIGIYFFYNSVVAIRHNHKLEVKLNSLEAKANLLEESNKNLELQKNYYSSPEYQAKALKENFNLVSPGEKVLVIKDLPPSKGSTDVFSELQELKRLINQN